jgi:RNA polymerase sigma-70 factor (ECF subfamily)
MTDDQPKHDPLEQLMIAAQRGDGRAYAELLRLVALRVRKIVQRQRGFAGQAEVEDLVQDILLSLHTVRATYDPKRPFVPWLMAIVRNRLADGARRYARTSGREVQVEAEDVTFFEVATNDECADLGDAATVRDAIRGLPAAQRQAIELLKLQELSLKEAATVSGASVASLKVATHRALASLRRTLGKKRT